MMNDTIVAAVSAAAKANGIEPAALLAIVEVETGGVAFEADGQTPHFLYERHVAFREATKKSKTVFAAFVRAGLAIPRWDKATQYRDERTSAQRLALIARARAIDEEVADASASWGLGQTMGNNCHEIGFASAVELVDRQTGSVEQQLDCMIRELKHGYLVEPLNKHDWAHVARVYNGPGYAANAYDTKLADAFRRYSRQLALPAQPAPGEAALTLEEIRAIQDRLRGLGYHELGEPDGHWDTRTTGAIAAFQRHEGLPVTGHYDAATKAALEVAQPREVSDERAAATADDLKQAGSRTVVAASRLSLIGQAKAAFGTVLVGGAGLHQSGILSTAQSAVDQANQVKGLWAQLHDLIAPLLTGPAPLLLGIILVIVGFEVWKHAEAIITARVDDHRTGVHAGPMED